MHPKKAIVLAVVSALCVAKFVLVSDLPLIQQYGAADSALYVERAGAIMRGKGLGAYDGMTLFKLPAFSFLIAFVRWLGIPFLLFQNILYTGGALYFFFAARAINPNVVARLVAFSVLLFLPVSTSKFWVHLFREPIEVSLVIFMVSSLLLLIRSFSRSRIDLVSLCVFSVSLVTAVCLREDAKLFLVLVPAVGVAAFLLFSRRASRLKPAVTVMAVPFALLLLADLGQRTFIKSHYGASMVHELSDGEFPGFVARLRSLKKKSDNRFIHVEFRNMRRLAELVPEFRPVVRWFETRQLPGRGMEGCKSWNICDELSGATFFEALKKAVYESGVGTTPVAAQNFYRHMNRRMDQLCGSEFECESSGNGLIPSFHLKWTRVGVQNFFHNIERAIFPRVRLGAAIPDYFRVDDRTAHLWQSVLMTHHSDTLRSEIYSSRLKWGPYSERKFEALGYWMRNPSVATSPSFGLERGFSGARRHFESLGKPEGLRWKNPKRSFQFFDYEAERRFINKLVLPMSVFIILLGTAVLSLSVRRRWERWFFIGVLGFVGFRISALSYVGIFLEIQDRLFFSTNVMWIVLGSFGVLKLARTIEKSKLKIAFPRKLTRAGESL